MTEQEIRNVADTLLQSNSNESNSQIIISPHEISHSHSINTITSIRPEYILSSADYFAGVRSNGRMSNIRRFFCLFVTFDLTFISLMWLIIIMINGENIVDALRKQVVHYDIHTSLFDIVLLAGCRFIILILFYAVCYIKHWIIIALSTTCTCVFLISKVFVYNWQSTDQQVFQVLLVLISFVLSWGETWFLDYKVLPQELQASQILISTPETERVPLIRNYVQGLPSMYTESVGNFYSPLESPEGSMHQIDFSNTRGKYQPARLSSEQLANYISQGKKALTESLLYLNRSDWKKSKESNGDVVEWLTPSPKARKIYKLTAVVNLSPKYLFEELFYRVETMTAWNPALLESHRVQIINEHTDISYQISANGAKGAVSSRDFINIRHWNYVDDCYVIGSVATEHPSIPRNDKCIRGENGYGCWLMRPLSHDPNSCQFEWVLNTDLKGWINSTILEIAYVNMMFEYVKNLRKFIITLKQTGRIL